MDEVKLTKCLLLGYSCRECDFLYGFYDNKYKCILHDTIKSRQNLLICADFKLKD